MNGAAQFGIYVHWPFCAAKCPYCDFNSHVAETIDHEAWRKAYEAELSYFANLTKGRTVSSVFFGGGTPSLMEPATAQKVIDNIQRHWRISNDCEITLEANPTSVEIDKFRAFRMAGINRVSIGVQSLIERDLDFLGRRHDAGQAKRAIDSAAQVFDRYSFDLIYARPQQTVSDWERELREALPLVRDHLSLYQLTIEKGTPFYMRHERGEFKIPDEEVAGDLYEITQDILESEGMRAYEVSNHARDGRESRHNLTYWRYTDYVGIGPGAHGRLTFDGRKQATRGHRAPDVWMAKVFESGHGCHDFEALSHEDRFTECLMMGLRLAEGIPVARLEEEGGKPFAQLIAPQKIEALRGEGLLTFDGSNLAATKAGLQRLNGVLSYLL
ncbi:MAG: coproporphyrinogen III oxidase [Micavibrio aeruginosavorus]|uniref:Heme chaperone HemW n=1 Tax=Micavibrio aeruginosavorus TaxID=349221 RepID=A0A2W5A191_9BACT|nr:MAG: coproporphyrinogen III oxidase [Micavibrio aeruginosavorus]